MHLDEIFIPIIEHWMRDCWTAGSHDGMQLFITGISSGYTEAFQHHITMLMRAFLYSRFQEEMMPRKPGCLEGFLEHYSRLPNESDKHVCGVAYFMDRWFKVVRRLDNEVRIVSECKLFFY